MGEKVMYKMCVCLETVMCKSYESMLSHAVVRPRGRRFVWTLSWPVPSHGPHSPSYVWSSSEFRVYKAWRCSLEDSQALLALRFTSCQQKHWLLLSLWCYFLSFVVVVVVWFVSNCYFTVLTWNTTTDLCLMCHSEIASLKHVNSVAIPTRRMC